MELTLQKKKKGDYGYRNSLKKKQIFKVGLLAAFILAQLGARYFTDNQSFKNILTVMAVVTVLPAANLASPLLAAFPYKTSSREFYEMTHSYEDNFPILYDLILTTKDFVLPMDAIIIHPTGIYAYCINQKIDAAEAEKSLNEILSAQRLDPNMKITKELYTFEKRLKSLKKASEYEDDGSVEYAVKLLKSLSM